MAIAASIREPSPQRTKDSNLGPTGFVCYATTCVNDFVNGLIRGLPSHHSMAKKPPDLPDAAQAIALRSMKMTSAPLAARRWAMDLPMTPLPRSKLAYVAPLHFRWPAPHPSECGSAHA